MLPELRAASTPARARMTRSSAPGSYCMYCLHTSTSFGSSSWRCTSSTSMLDQASFTAARTCTRPL